MLELEQRTGSWTPFMVDGDDHDTVPINRITTDETVQWVRANPPRELPFSSARRLATDYANHVSEAQHSAMRDKVFVGCIATRETVEVSATR